MTTQYHVEGTCQIEYSTSEKIDEIYVSELVVAESEVAAIVAVANDLMSDLNYRSFVWQNLSVTLTKKSKQSSLGVMLREQQMLKVARML
jgi:hypothetical protein